jgi:hypothetical protein
MLDGLGVDVWKEGMGLTGWEHDSDGQGLAGVNHIGQVGIVAVHQRRIEMVDEGDIRQGRIGAITSLGH